MHFGHMFGPGLEKILPQSLHVMSFIKKPPANDRYSGLPKGGAQAVWDTYEYILYQQAGQSQIGSIGKTMGPVPARSETGRFVRGPHQGFGVSLRGLTLTRCKSI
jgi:hypothetical protein